MRASAAPRPRNRAGIYVLLALGVIPTLLPLVWLLRSSVMGDAQIFSSPPEWIPDPFKPQNYGTVFEVQPFLRYLGNTLIVEAGALVGTLLSCSLAAFSFSRMRWRGRDLVFGITLSTLLLPYAFTIIPTFWMWRTVGAIDTFWPLITPSFFGAAGMHGAFYIFLLRQFFMNIPYELDEAAYVDGASPW